MRSGLARVARFWWEFVVGDDWRLALASLVGFAITATLAAAGLAAWWVLPVVVIAALLIVVTSATTKAVWSSGDGRDVKGSPE
jgi:hypothetical protein